MAAHRKSDQRRENPSQSPINRSQRSTKSCRRETLSATRILLKSSSLSQFARALRRWQETERSRSRRSPEKSPGPTTRKTPAQASFVRTGGRGKERDELGRKRYGGMEARSGW